MTTLNSQPAGARAWLLAFTWGATQQHVAYYTTWDTDLTVGGITYSSTIGTRLKVDPATQTAGAKDEPWQITMPPVTPLTLLARNSVFATVTCSLAEIDPTATTPTPAAMWSGTVTQTWLNPKEAPGAIKAEVSGVRLAIQYPMGIESKTQCARTFGDRWCGFNLASVQQSAVITSVAGKTIAAPTLTIPSGRIATYWSWGTISIDGLQIAIQDGSLGVSALRLLQTPPPEWLGQTAVFSPGCTKFYDSPGGCFGWGNQLRFFGIGYAKPNVTPLISPR